MEDNRNLPLLECNPLTRRDSPVWRMSKEPKENFDFSDGDAAEEALKNMMINTQDLTSQSPELEEKIVDWSSEYHLSSNRANLIKSLDLKGIKNALELGCGCGAITRYLGELDINVDAVEGSFRRAEIARLRCRGLENVNVINANFNELTFPKKTYDAIFLVGVLEYARKFFPTAADHKEAVIKILTLVAPALKKRGLLFVAIENRMGLKYWLGASEDHCGQSFIGLYGYPQDQGIRTYDKSEWEEILDKVGIQFHRFIYPFPDYKLARVILSDAYVKQDEYAYSPLYRIYSRDYLKVWRPPCDEFLLWKSLHQSGCLEDFSNSFFIIVSDNREQLENVFSFDFVHYPDTGRKPGYRAVTMKPRHESRIIKKKTAGIDSEKKDAFVQQDLSDGIYYQGPLLVSLWLDSLAGYDYTIAFEKLIRNYYRFLLKYFGKQDDPSDAFDLTPFNMIVDDKGSYRIIDKEWVVATEIRPEYVLFRALLWFSRYSKSLLSPVCEMKNIFTVQDFIAYGFNLASLSLDQSIDAFIEMEEQVQAAVTIQKTPDFIRSMLNEPLSETASSVPQIQSKERQIDNGRPDEMKTPLHTVVVPVYNSKDTLRLLVDRISSIMADNRIRFDLVLVDDGSDDGSFDEIKRLAKANSFVRGVRLSRNFGHQAALVIGLAKSRGDFIAILDDDLQDPPEMLPQFFQRLYDDVDVVYGIRKKRKENFIKKFFYAVFYRVLRILSKTEIPLDAGDFCVMKRCVVDAMLEFKECHPFLRGIRAWVGFKQIGIDYQREPRPYGKSGYTIKKYFALAATGILSFSYVPLRLATIFGMMAALIGFAFGAYVICLWFIEPFEVSGYASMIVVITFLGGIQLICIGILGEYIARLSDNARKRQVAVVAETTFGEA